MSEPTCDQCNGTGYYGDQGPGREGNREWHVCDKCAPPSASPKSYIAQLEASHAALVKALEHISQGDMTRDEYNALLKALSTAKKLTGEETPHTKDDAPLPGERKERHYE